VYEWSKIFWANKASHNFKFLAAYTINIDEVNHKIYKEKIKNLRRSAEISVQVSKIFRANEASRDFENLGA
jgi:hypothetical protein